MAGVQTSPVARLDLKYGAQVAACVEKLASWGDLGVAGKREALQQLFSTIKDGHVLALEAACLRRPYLLPKCDTDTGITIHEGSRFSRFIEKLTNAYVLDWASDKLKTDSTTPIHDILMEDVRWRQEVQCARQIQGEARTALYLERFSSLCFPVDGAVDDLQVKLFVKCLGYSGDKAKWWLEAFRRRNAHIVSYKGSSELTVIIREPLFVEPKAQPGFVSQGYVTDFGLAGCPVKLVVASMAYGNLESLIKHEREHAITSRVWDRSAFELPIEKEVIDELCSRLAEGGEYSAEGLSKILETYLLGFREERDCYCGDTRANPRLTALIRRDPGMVQGLTDTVYGPMVEAVEVCLQKIAEGVSRTNIIHFLRLAGSFSVFTQMSTVLKHDPG